MQRPAKRIRTEEEETERERKETGMNIHTVTSHVVKEKPQVSENTVIVVLRILSLKYLPLPPEQKMGPGRW